MATTGYDVYNLRNILNAAASFRYCDGASLSLAQAMRAGWRDVGHVIASDISPSTSATDHRYCRLGRIGTDKKFISEAKLEFGIKCEEMTQFVLMLALMGAEAEPLTQSALATDTGIDTLDFTASAPSGDAATWYNLTRAGIQQRELTLCRLAAAARAVTVDAATDEISLASHGFAVDTPVTLSGSSLPGGVTADRVYRVRPVDAGRFRLSESAGGAPLDLVSAGVDVTVEQVLTHPGSLEEVGVVIDSKLGAVRFLYPVSQVVSVTVRCPAIDALNQPESLLRGVSPLRNLSRIGYCRLLFYADEAPNKLVGDYLFRGQILAKGSPELDGAKAAQFDFTITVLDDPGTFYVAP